MPAERVPMRQARENIRLKLSAGVATREIARASGRELQPRSLRAHLLGKSPKRLSRGKT